MTRPLSADRSRPRADDRSARADSCSPGTGTRPPLADLCAVGAAVLLVAAAASIGSFIQHTDHTLHVDWPPLLASWHPHLGPGTPAAVLVAVAVVAWGPALAARLPWRRLLAVVWAAAAAWTWSLALVDGWRRGVASRLTTHNEYLTVVHRFDDIPATLRDFTAHILMGSPDNWPAHVAGHPPASTLTFVLLDRIGLGGGGWAGAWCVTLGATAGMAVLVAVRSLAGEQLARRAAPFVAMTPAAVWVGASADGYFAAVAAWFVALFAVAVTCASGPRRHAAAVGAGLLFGLLCYLSYGLTLFALIAAGVPAATLSRPSDRGRPNDRDRPGDRDRPSDRDRLGDRDRPGDPDRPHGTCRLRGAARSARLLPAFLAGLAPVPLLFTLSGFNWYQAYGLLTVRYYQGVGGVRPYGYWVWANLACTVVIVGLATAAGLRRAIVTAVAARRGPAVSPAARLALLVLSALLALLVADLSGMSKAETERIWLPFAFWLLPACALLPRPRAWLVAQAALPLLVNHLLLTAW